MKIANLLWKDVEDILNKIKEHKFIKGLASDELPIENFKYYIIQDFYYLNDFSRVLAILASKSWDSNKLSTFLDHARVAITFERQLHEELINKWKINPNSYEMNLINIAYVGYLYKVAVTGSFPELISSVLPCYWIYLDVGKMLSNYKPKTEEYRKWIETYSSKEYEEPVKAIIEIINEIGEEVSQREKEKMRKHFRMCSNFEYLFWDYSLRMQMFSS
jgi:thiaminase/transcriptional activator TenA